MKHLRTILSWQKFEEELSKIIARFPVTFITIVSAGVVLMLMIADNDFFSDDVFGRLLLTLSFLFWTSVSAVLFCESMRYSKRTGLLFNAFVVLAGSFYYVVLPHNLSGLSFEFFLTQFLVHFALALSVSFTFIVGEYIRNNYKDIEYYNTTFAYGTSIFLAVVVGVCVSLSGSALLGTIDLLFSPEWLSHEAYLYVLVAAWIFAGPLFLLSRLPGGLVQELKAGDAFMQFIVRYIATPFIVIYFIILYLYTIQVLANFSQWPQGEVAWLVIWFSIFGYVSYILSFHLKHERFVSLVRTWFPILLIPQLAMLFYAIGLRIDQYGWTVNRYIVVVFGIWLVGLSLYYIVAKQKSKLVCIPASLFVVTIIVSVGPWSMFNISVQSQTNKINHYLATGIDNLSQAEKGNVASSIRYLCQYHGCNTVYSIEQLNELLPEKNLNYWEIQEALGVTEIYAGEHDEIVYYYFNHDLFSVDGFKTLTEFNSYDSSQDNNNAFYDTKQQSLKVGDASIALGVSQIDLELNTVNSNPRERQLEGEYFDITHLDKTYRVFISNMTINDGLIENMFGWVAY